MGTSHLSSSSRPRNGCTCHYVGICMRRSSRTGRGDMSSSGSRTSQSQSPFRPASTRKSSDTLPRVAGIEGRTDRELSPESNPRGLGQTGHSQEEGPQKRTQQERGARDQVPLALPHARATVNVQYNTYTHKPFFFFFLFFFCETKLRNSKFP